MKAGASITALLKNYGGLHPSSLLKSSYDQNNHEFATLEDRIHAQEIMNGFATPTK
jgi:hypothetical protein